MASDYPAAIHTFVRPATDGSETRTVAEVVSEVMDVVEAIQEALGTAPGGAYESVVERLDEFNLGDLADVTTTGAGDWDALTFHTSFGWTPQDGTISHEARTDDPHTAAKYLIHTDAGGHKITVGTSGHATPAAKDIWLDTTGS